MTRPIMTRVSGRSTCLNLARLRQVMGNWFVAESASRRVVSILEILVLTAGVVMYGARLPAEWGSDFGVYFVGSKSISEDFGLYTGFFDHKGPFFYGLLRFMGFFVPYTIGGAAILASALALLWLASIELAARILNLNLSATRMLRMSALAVLIGQNTNSSIALVQISLLVVGFACMIRFLRRPLLRWHFIATFLGGLAVLTRIDAIILASVFLLGPILGRKILPQIQISLALGSSALSLAALAAVFVGLSNFLNFTFAAFWRQAVMFNATVYRDYLNFSSQSIGTPLSENLTSILPHIELASKNGFLAASALVLTVGFPPKTAAWRIPAASLLVGFILLGATGSEKNYYFLILIPWVFIAYLLAASALRPQTVKSMYVIFAFASILELTRLIPLHSCVVTQSNPCPSPYSRVVAASDPQRTTHFLINQGWPYLLASTHPEVSFTARFAFLPEETDLLTALLERKAAGDVFWLSDDTLDYVSTLTGSGVEAFMSGMRQHGPSMGPFTPFSVDTGQQHQSEALATDGDP